MCSLMIYAPPVSKKDSRPWGGLSPGTTQILVTALSHTGPFLRHQQESNNRKGWIRGNVALAVECRAAILPFGRA